MRRASAVHGEATRGLVAARPLLVVLLVAVAAACAPSPEEVLEQARDSARQGDRVRAIAHYQEYLEENPDDYAARKEYTMTLGEQWAFAGGDRAPIIDNLQTLYEERPNDRQIQGLLAVMLVRDGQAAAESQRWEEAEAAYRRAVAVNPESGQPQYELGKLYEQQERLEEAFVQYRAAAAKRPNIPDLYLRLGRAYLERDDPDRAIVTLQLVLESRISSYLVPEAHCELARAYDRKGLGQESNAHLEEAAEDCRLN